MENLIVLSWILVILIEVAANWFKIEKLKEYPNHFVWFVPRLVVGIVFLAWFANLGFVWYWSALYIVGSHMLIFPEILNISRNKGLGYLGDRNLNAKTKSIYDKIVMTVVKYPFAWLSFRVVLALFAIGNMLLQGKMSWSQINGY